MPTYNIVLLPGDGIGPEVVHETRLVLEDLAPAFGFNIQFETHLLGHLDSNRGMGIENISCLLIKRDAK